jgi:PPOX class probable F420-dependent enzyme
MLDDDTIVSAVDDVKPKRSSSLARLDNVRATPRASMIVDEYDDSDWAALWWVRADGVARVVESGAECDAAVAALAAKYPQYAANPPAGPAIIIAVTRWATWSHDQRGRVRRGG